MADNKNVKVRSSIVYKLNTRLFFRLFSLFLTMDLILCAGGFLSFMVYSERTVSSTAEVVKGSGLPDVSSTVWFETTGTTVSQLAVAHDGLKIPKLLRWVFPKNTAEGVRGFQETQTGRGFFRNLNSLRYNVDLNYYSVPYRVSVDLGRFATTIKYVLLILLIWQILMLFSSILWGAKMLRSTLRPITQLTHAAQSLNTANRSYTPEEMQKLAGRLDGIDAEKLDTRIPVDGVQEEFRGLAMAINGMLDRINESYRAQVRFVSDASHELRTPISVIQGYANLLDRWGKNDEKALQESIDAIKDESSNMKNLVEQLLFLARGDNNTMTLSIVQIDLAALLTDITRETKMIDGGHDFDCKVSPVSVMADEGLIKQAMRILIDNAMKYTPASGHISVAVSEKEGQAVLSVTDDGIGIPPDAVPHIFDRFYRADESRARATGGTGLGLSIAQWIAERHGGHMEVLSREEIGTKISIVLPATQKSLAK
ncbi:MAG: ATP-binding protein [Bacillota bacterium]|nr:ATP-binding protein [Bacillota bacterium]